MIERFITNFKTLLISNLHICDFRKILNLSFEIGTKKIINIKFRPCEQEIVTKC